MEPPASRCFTFNTTSAAWWGRGIDGLIGHVPSFLHDPNIENLYAASARIGRHHEAGAGESSARWAGLAAVGADEVVALTDDHVTTRKRLAGAAAEVDIVVDYLWGEPATITMMAVPLLHRRRKRTQHHFAPMAR